MNTVVLNNTGPADSTLNSLYYPRLQVNKRGEIVLATGKHGSLTTGVMVGKTADCNSQFEIGKKFSDWEVGGELEDYNGEVAVVLKNLI